MKNSQRKLDPTAVKSSAADMSDNPEVVLPVLSSGELGRVQEILFGTQMRSNSEQLQQLKAHYDQQILQLTEHFNSQLQTLDQKTSEDKTEFSKKLKLQRSLQDEKGHQLSASLKLAESTLNAKLDRSADEFRASHTELKDQFEDSCTQLSKTVESVRDDLVSRLNDAVAALQEQKLDRKVLADMLGNVAMQLSDSSQSLSSGTPDSVCDSNKR